MLTLTEARAAMNRGDSKTAGEILRVVLRESPSADAWYMAAQLAPTQEKAVMCLHQALLIDAEHGASLTALRMLGGSPETVVGVVKEEIVETIVEESNRRRFLRNLSRRQQIAFASVLGLFGIVSIVLALAMAISVLPKFETVPAMGPTPVPMIMASADRFVSEYHTSGLILLNLQVGSDPLVKKGKLIRFYLQDGKGELYPVSIQVYDSVSALIDSWNSGAGNVPAAQVIGASNAVLIFPNRLPGYLSTPLVSTFRSVTGV
jgi:hypothetical protein